MLEEVSGILPHQQAQHLSPDLLRLMELALKIGISAPYSVSVMTQSGVGVSVWISRRGQDGRFALLVEYIHLERSELRLRHAIEDVEAILQGTYKEVEPIGRTIGSIVGF